MRQKFDAGQEDDPAQGFLVAGGDGHNRCLAVQDNAMEITSFDDLLRAARSQGQPQRLLFVFAGATLPADASAEQRAGFEAGAGGELAPLMCVDKAAEDVAGFGALSEESRQFGQEWAIVFAAALSGRGGLAPTAAETEAALQRMVEAVRAGSVAAFIPFDRQGRPVNLVS